MEQIDESVSEQAESTAESSSTTSTVYNDSGIAMVE